MGIFINGDLPGPSGMAVVALFVFQLLLLWRPGDPATTSAAIRQTPYRGVERANSRQLGTRSTSPSDLAHWASAALQGKFGNSLFYRAIGTSR